MILTEEEARTKWCPHARVADAEAQTASNNRFAMSDGSLCNHHTYRCIASDCMAWRWHNVQVVEKDFDGTITVISEDNGKGYCGLAGKP